MGVFSATFATSSAFATFASVAPGPGVAIVGVPTADGTVDGAGATSGPMA
jgi:hypothetical protein